MATPKVQWVKENGLGVSVMAVDFAKVVTAAATSTPILGAAAEILCSILQQISQTQQNAVFAKKIADRCVRIFTEIHEMLDRSGVASGSIISSLIEKFEMDLSDVKTFVATEVQKNVLLRFLLAKKSAEQLKDLQERVDETMKLFQTKTLILLGAAAERGLSNTQHVESVVSGKDLVEEDYDVANLSHIALREELFAGNGFRFHSTIVNGRVAAVVKVFEGRDAQQNWRKTVEFDETVMHSHILPLKAKSVANSRTPFTVYSINVPRSPELFIATAISSGVNPTFVAGATLISSISSALDYLDCSDIPLDSVDIENISIFMDDTNKVVLSLNTYHGLSNSTLSDIPPSQTILDAFNQLCLKTFNAANQSLYQDYIVRDEDMSIPSDMVVGSSLGVGPKDDGLFYIPDSVNDAEVSQSRRVIIYQPLDDCAITLKDISRQFKGVLESQSFTSFPLGRTARVNRVRGGRVWHGSHRCKGYLRKAVTMTSMVKNCRVITDTTPILHELCPICGERVQEGPFRCVCGTADDGVSPTVRCSECLARGHSRCSTAKDFLCKDCVPGGTSRTLEEGLGQYGEGSPPESRGPHRLPGHSATSITSAPDHISSAANASTLESALSMVH
ncbi:hypothetical protein EV421DRAFT_1466173 [Armillaria borealis]|uniref:Uncharacterized protein n=1 Tax=Armillaria borealis TaxID=47425 RepID=A0AA39MW94_9AGAR|nr:hypothetical protein EV421DRAFT_1466173 [Armillaria borealis]